MIEWIKRLFKKDLELDSDFDIIKENHEADIKYRELCVKLRDAKMELVVGTTNYNYSRFRFEDLRAENIQDSLEKEVNHYFKKKYTYLKDEEDDGYRINDLQIIESKTKGLDARLSRAKFCLALKLFDGTFKYFSFDEEGLNEINQLIDREMGDFE